MNFLSKEQELEIYNLARDTHSIVKVINARGCERREGDLARVESLEKGFIELQGSLKGLKTRISDPGKPSQNKLVIGISSIIATVVAIFLALVEHFRGK